MSGPATPYRVLARKYRPQSFAELIGQEAMVRTLRNAIETGRIAHAFILTGVRGVGKTTTARIIARALNCSGRDGAGPTVEPCGECEHCRAIAEDRHVDVIEMDAASRTGVDDIRELADGVRYRPVSARYKVYIIDEVHMLSKNAFNALLKTLEEPPPDVIFVFATTEIHKVPVTVLSRCQRFSLRRVPPDLLARHYARIAEVEGLQVAPAALALIARAADGSVRDGLSLLDQAAALAGGEAIGEKAVRDMLGIADRGQLFDLFEAAMRGDAPAALDRMAALYEGGADPLLVLQDLLELCHFVTRLKLAPDSGGEDPFVEGERGRARPLADKLSLPVLARVWQMLLKGLEEVQSAPAPLPAAEMILIRLAYAADLPSPADLVRTLGSAAAPGAEPALRTAAPSGGVPSGGAAAPVARQSAAALAAPAESPPPATASVFEPMPQSFAEVVALCDQRREAKLRAELAAYLHLVRFEPGRIECRLKDGAPSDLANRLGRLLGEWTGTRWLVAVSDAEGMPTLHEAEEERQNAVRDTVAAHPLVQAVLETFPGAKIAAIRERFISEADSPEEPDAAEDVT
jgi:DNA polymerase-3 subunit gamma/tau